jgi:Protein of unknown function (DUF3618)
MGEDEGQAGARELADDREKSPEQLRAEIEETREELGETAAALAGKTDVKARAREKADELKRAAISRKDELLSKAPGGSDPASGGGGAALAQLRTTARQNPVPTAALGALIGGFVLGRITRRGD